MQIFFDSTLAQVFIDTDEPIFPTEGIYSSGDYKTLMNLVRAANNIEQYDIQFFADHSHGGDAGVNDDEECGYFCLFPPFPPTWEVLQEARA